MAGGRLERFRSKLTRKKEPKAQETAIFPERSVTNLTTVPESSLSNPPFFPEPSISRPTVIPGTIVSNWHSPAELEASILAQNQINQEREDYLLREEHQQRMSQQQQSYENDRNAQAEVQRKKDNASARAVRHLRELMREKYRLDVDIWDKRTVQQADRPIVKVMYEKSDRIWQEILFIVNDWEEHLFDPEDWGFAKKIKAQLNNKSARFPLWADVQPWDPSRELDLS